MQPCATLAVHEEPKSGARDARQQLQLLALHVTSALSHYDDHEVIVVVDAAAAARLANLDVITAEDYRHQDVAAFFVAGCPPDRVRADVHAVVAAFHDGFDCKDVCLVAVQASCTPQQAVGALRKNEGDIVNAIMELTM